MGKTSGSGAVASKPPRYEDVVGDTSDSDAPASGSAVTVAPASASRGTAHLAARSTDFEHVATEDEPFDRDRPRRSRVHHDGVTRALGLDTAYTPAASFSWCRDSWKHPMSFSRCYVAPDVLVDLFANRGRDVLHEIEQKQKAVREHNAAAQLQVERAMEESSDDADLAARMLVLRRDKNVPYTYIPLVGLPLEIDARTLAPGTILDLPA